jgi:hypothetical protein
VQGFEGKAAGKDLKRMILDYRYRSMENPSPRIPDGLVE